MYAAAVVPMRPVLLLPPPIQREPEPIPEPRLAAPENWKADRETVRRIMRAVCAPRGIVIDAMWGATRMRRFVPARDLSIWAVMTILQNTSLEWVGRQFNRDHSTILYSFRKIEARRGELEGEIRALGNALGIPELVTLRRDTSRRAVPQPPADSLNGLLDRR